MRNYEKVVREGIRKNGETYQVKVLNNGLKKVHIGEDVWLYGRQKYVDGKSHMVIYGPNRKEYHVWGKDVTNLITTDDSDHYDNWSLCNRQGNRAIESKVKIYILTAVLDKKENWNFNLNDTPEIGNLKVIYHNGTVKNIKFDGEFKDVQVTNTKYSWRKNILKPVGYRLVNKPEERDKKIEAILN